MTAHQKQAQTAQQTMTHITARDDSTQKQAQTARGSKRERGASERGYGEASAALRSDETRARV